MTGNLPARFVSDIVIDPRSATTIYASLSGFRSGHVYRSTSGGGNWQDISGNLPDAPTNALVINPRNPLNLFVGTDVGAFQTLNGGTSWTAIPGIPTVAVFDMAINANLGILRAATHGRGVYELKLTGGGFTPIGPAAVANGQVFGPRQTVSGRITSLAVDPLNPNIIYLGAAQGGLWRSMDGGQNWQPMTDSAPTQATGAIAVFADNVSPNVSIQMPNGGETLAANRPFNITWSAGDNVGLVRQDIALSTDEGNTFPITIASGLAGDIRSFVWSVPNIETTKARIRITVFDATNNQAMSVSKSNFTITSGDFTIAVSPTTQSLIAGASATFTINVQALDGFNQPVNLTTLISPADPNVTATIAASTINAGDNTTLTINTATITQTATFTVMITATGGQLVRSRSANIKLDVISPDFSLVFDPAQITVQRGKSVQINAMVKRVGNFTGNVTISAPDTKALKIKVTPASSTTNATAVNFTLKVKKPASPGTQQLTFSARDDAGRVRTGVLTVSIQ